MVPARHGVKAESRRTIGTASQRRCREQHLPSGSNQWNLNDREWLAVQPEEADGHRSSVRSDGGTRRPDVGGVQQLTGQRIVNRVDDASSCTCQVGARRGARKPRGGASHIARASAQVDDDDASPALRLKVNVRPENWSKDLAEPHHEHLPPGVPPRAYAP